ncbi:unknown [Mint virus 1]|uniref:Uncharacterized protein n=1 Tax=Mint virus 1 TaxID=300740 RepID=Q5G7G0_9CLOS|nr:unknown [Mint virus 1]AAW32898.1 unknown [Mint virus 1]
MSEVSFSIRPIADGDTNTIVIIRDKFGHSVLNFKSPAGDDSLALVEESCIISRSDFESVASCDDSFFLAGLNSLEDALNNFVLHSPRSLTATSESLSSLEYIDFVLDPIMLGIIFRFNLKRRINNDSVSLFRDSLISLNGGWYNGTLYDDMFHYLSNFFKQKKGFTIHSFELIKQNEVVFPSRVLRVSGDRGHQPID